VYGTDYFFNKDIKMKKLIIITTLMFTLGSLPGLVSGKILDLDYSTYVGGSGEDQGRGIGLDLTGRIYLMGYTASSDFPTENPYQAGYAGGSRDIFASALSSSGSTLFYSTFLGGIGNDTGMAISLGKGGAVYITGYTYSYDFPTENPYQAQHTTGVTDVLVSSLSSTGSALIYSTYLGGSASDFGQDISVGTDGTAYITGWASSSNFPTVNPFQAASAGAPDVFVSALSSTGSFLVYSTYLGGSDTDNGMGISRGMNGVTYVAGDTESSDFPTENPFQAGYAGGSRDVFVTALSSTGSILSYSTYLGGTGYDVDKAISLGTDDTAYLIGYTNSIDFPKENPYQGSNSGGSNDVFVSVISSTGSVLSYSTYLGGSGDDKGYGINPGPDGGVYLIGDTDSSDFPTENPYQAFNRGGDKDVFVSALDLSGSVLSYSTYLGGAGKDLGRGITLETDGGVYIVGNTESSDFPTQNPYQADKREYADVFVSRLIFIGTPTPTPSPSPSLTPTPLTTPSPRLTPTPLTTPSTEPTPISGPSATPTPASNIPWITDYNGDGTSDIAIFRENSGLWAIRGISRLYFGATADNPAPGDYDGDGTTDVGIYRSSSGLWALRGITRIYFGGSADEPLAADYDGDGTSAPAIFRPSSGLWAVRGITRTYFGGSSDSPIPGYYSGTGVASIAIFRPSTGLWAIQGITRRYFGSSTDDTVPGDYNGDGSWNPAIFRPASGLWALAGVSRTYFGAGTDRPVPGVYSGTGTDEIGIFRPSSGLWAVKGITRVYFGGSTDLPVTR